MSLPLTFPFLKRKIPALPDIPLTEYWLVFTESKEWIGYFLKPHFGHCYVLTRDEYNWWVMNPERLQLRVEIAAAGAREDLIKLHCKETDTVLKLTFRPRHTVTRFGIMGLFSCVTVARYILGLRLKALTPFGLYKKLISLSYTQKLALRLAEVKLIQQGMLPCHESVKP